MNVSKSSCYRNVGGKTICRYCNECCIKYGRFKNKQRYRCSICKRTFMNSYTYNGCKADASVWIQDLLKEGSGIRSISRLLRISVTTVLRRILSIAKAIRKPVQLLNKAYEVDEMRTFYKSKTRRLWIVYALRQDTKTVADFAVGRRTADTLKKVIDTLQLSEAQKIYTDRFRLYKTVVPAALHQSKLFGTNRIERKNLSLRTHLKRLNRRTICYSKSMVVLVACLKIYFWS